MSEKKIKVEYGGSVPWLIFWLVVFFPVGLILFVTAGKFDLNGARYSIRYDGSRRWLGFWALVFFPVSLALLVLNGVALVKEERKKLE